MINMSTQMMSSWMTQSELPGKLASGRPCSPCPPHPCLASSRATSHVSMIVFVLPLLGDFIVVSTPAWNYVVMGTQLHNKACQPECHADVAGALHSSMPDVEQCPTQMLLNQRTTCHMQIILALCTQMQSMVRCLFCVSQHCCFQVSAC